MPGASATSRYARSSALLYALLLPAVFGQASAAEPADRTGEITPFVGYRVGGEFDVVDGDGTVELEAAPSAGVALDVFAAGNASYQLFYARQSTDLSRSGSADTSTASGAVIHALQFGGTYRGDSERFQPYLAATLGATLVSTTGDSGEDDTFFSGSLGVGVNARPTSRLDLRLEGRAYGTLIDADTDLFCATGPVENVCAVRVEGSLLLQFEVSAGVTFRF